MINAMQRAVIKKDFKSVTSNKRLFSVLIIVPLVLTVILPSVFVLVLHFVPVEELGDFQQILKLLTKNPALDSLGTTVTSLLLNNFMPIFFIIVPIMASSVMAASSFVGEKEKKTLETLLYCPLSLKQIFQSKVWASFLLSMVVSLTSFAAMFLVIEIEMLVLTGGLLLPGISWVVMLLIVSPAVSLLAITLIVGGSAKAQTMEESQQRSVFLILPLLLLIAGQLTGVILINAWILLGAGVALSVLAWLLLKNAMGKFTYELLLR